MNYFSGSLYVKELWRTSGATKELQRKPKERQRKLQMNTDKKTIYQRRR